MKSPLFCAVVAFASLHFSMSMADSASEYDTKLRKEWNDAKKAYKEKKEAPLGWGWNDEDIRRDEVRELRKEMIPIHRKLLVRAISTCQQCSEDTSDKCEEQFEFLEKNNIFWRCDSVHIPISTVVYRPDIRNDYEQLAAIYLDTSANCPPHKTITYGLEKAVEKTQNDKDKYDHERNKELLEVAQQAEKEEAESTS